MYDVTIKLKYTDGDKTTERDLDCRRMFIHETDELKALTGYLPQEWMFLVDAGDGKARGFAWYLACQRAGDEITWMQVLDEFNLFDLEHELELPDEPAKPEENDADPTGSENNESPT